MPYIKVSSDFLFGTSGSLLGRVINLYSYVYWPTGGGAQFGILSQNPRDPNWGYWRNGNLGFLRLMSGTMPSNPSTLTNNAPPGTAILWEVYADRDIGTFNPTADRWYVNPTQINTIFASITATGTASWFWICTNNGETAQTTWHHIIGDVGLIGSGSELEVYDTQLVSGQFARVINLNLRMSQDLLG